MHFFTYSSIESFQIHPSIKVRHLVCVSIEDFGLSLAKFTEAAFPRLTPAGMAETQKLSARILLEQLY
ncbi:hypothetical protein AMJ44_05680 [candidate division WOR-1 bacterium DG_54_3]|uniref:Uncharacterized protein n=1 Tax=candidate division WOR-1 bacterium DG_54_3 TaxID=1703775 RepID=A0A0S7Y2T7_UNCSA|nr:MAG: hypothetical protein AMJ44_05680 [candidate division WOR-1 bacterium DG_54_3]